MTTRLIRMPSARLVTRLGAMMLGSTGRKKENIMPMIMKLPIAYSQKLFSLMSLWWHGTPISSHIRARSNDIEWISMGEYREIKHGGSSLP